MLRVEIKETHVLLVEVKFGFADRTVTVLFHQDLGDIGAIRFFIDLILAMDEHHHVGVLLDGAGIAQVGKAWASAALLHGARELRESQDRHVKFARQYLKRARDFGYLLHHGVGRLGGGGGHELKVVHDQEIEAVLVMQAASRGTHLQNVGARLVVDVNRGFGESRHGRLHRLEFLIALQFTGTKLPRVDTGLRSQHAVDELLGAHLEREDADGLLVLHGGIASQVERESSLTHGRARGQDDQVRLLKSGQKVVDGGEAGGDAADVFVIGGEVFKALPSFGQSRTDGDEFLQRGLVGDLIDLLLGLIESGIDIFRIGITEFGDIVRRVNEPAQTGLILDFGGVINGVAGGGHAFDQVSQIGSAAHAL